MGRPVLGLALGSGAAKGFAHIGVLKALEERGIVPDVVTGSSMGSLIGAFYVCGMAPSFMERLACTLTWRHWVDFHVSKVGMIGGEKIHQMVTLLTKGMEFGQVSRPFGVVATELTQKQSVLFREGRISDAVRASISIPGVFVPYVTEAGVFVDGGVLDRVPVEAAKVLGADVVIGVDVASIQRTTVPETAMDVIMQSLDLMQQQMVQQLVSNADVLVEPDLIGIGTSHFHKAKEAIEIGYTTTMQTMEDILCLVASDNLETS